MHGDTGQHDAAFAHTVGGGQQQREKKRQQRAGKGKQTERQGRSKAQHAHSRTGAGAGGNADDVRRGQPVAKNGLEDKARQPQRGSWKSNRSANAAA